MWLAQQRDAHSSDGSPEHENCREEALWGTREPSRGSEAKQLAQYDTEVESGDVYQVPLGDVGSPPEADSAVPASFKDVGKAPFDQFATLALQRFALGAVYSGPGWRTRHVL
jgi:hypothetical protein